MGAKPSSIRDRVVAFRRVKASELLPNPDNWRTHGKAQKAALAGALQEIGFAGAVLTRRVGSKLQIIDGHLRSEIRGQETVPVLVTDLSAAEADKLIAVYDPIAAMAGTDKQALAALLARVETENEGLQALLAQLGKTTEIVEDAPGPVPDDPKCKLGDLFVLGDHRLLCGDSTKPEDVERLFAGAAPGMMVTDPPYGVEYDPEWRDRAGVGDGSKRKGVVTNDARSDWREAWALWPGAVAYVWFGSLHASEVQVSLDASGLVPRSLIIWAKQTAPISRGAYHWQHEPCWYAVRKGCGADWIGGRKQTTLWEIDAAIGFMAARAVDGDSETSHSTSKPVECMARAIRNHGCREIYDPFLGSGSTLIACERLKRRCYGMELDPAYVRESVTRWEKLTGKKAVQSNA